MLSCMSNKVCVIASFVDLRTWRTHIMSDGVWAAGTGTTSTNQRRPRTPGLSGQVRTGALGDDAVCARLSHQPGICAFDVEALVVPTLLCDRSQQNVSETLSLLEEVVEA